MPMLDSSEERRAPIEWIGIDAIGIDQMGIEWIGMDAIGVDCTAFWSWMPMLCIGADTTGPAGGLALLGSAMADAGRLDVGTANAPGSTVVLSADRPAV